MRQYGNTDSEPVDLVVDLVRLCFKTNPVLKLRCRSCQNPPALLFQLSSQGITTDDYDKKCQELKNKQFRNNEIMKSYLKADQNFKITVNTVLSIASKAYELFESSNIKQKRKLINYVFSNFELEGLTLRYSLKLINNLPLIWISTIDINPNISCLIINQTGYIEKLLFLTHCPQIGNNIYYFLLIEDVSPAGH